MKPWEVWTADVGHGPHPVVIVSNASRVTLKPEVVVLTCSSHRTQRPPREHEVILDEAEGLDWPTLCRCDLLYTLAKSSLIQRRGQVSAIRRREIAKRILQSLALEGL